MAHPTSSSTEKTKSALVTQGLPVFFQNQTLTDEDLNRIVKNLIEQQLDRASLIGVGIFNGLSVASHYSAETAAPGVAAETVTETVTATPPTRATIVVSAGTFVTDDGYYLALDQGAVLTHYQRVENKFNKPVIELFDIDGPNRRALDRDLDGALRAKAAFEASLAEQMLVLRVEPRVRSRRALLTYDVIGEKEEVVIRFFLVPKPVTDEPFFLNPTSDSNELPKDSFTVLKQQRSRHHFLSQASPAPQLHRFGYVAEAPASISVKALTSYTAVRQNYQQICERAIATLGPALDQVGTLATTFPKLAQAIAQLDSQPTLDAPFAGITERLSQQLTEEVATSTDATKPLALQYFYDYLATLIAAYHELTEGITEISDYLVEVTQQDFLMLGPVLASEQADLSAAELAANRSQFSPTVQTPSTTRHLARAASLYLRLIHLCEADSFVLTPTAPDILLTPGGDRTAPLSQQAIPYYLDYEKISPYWSYEAAYTGRTASLPAYHNRPSERLLTASTASEFYRIEGHLEKSSQTVLQEILGMRDRYNLAFDIVFLKLEAELTTTSELPILPGKNDHLFHNFAQQYPGIAPLGGVHQGGTFVLVYVETSDADTSAEDDLIVADFALPYAIGPNALSLQPPSSFTLSFEAGVSGPFQNTDHAQYKISLRPKGGTLTGPGLVEAAGEIYFQPSQILTETISPKQVDIIGRWENHVKTLSVTVSKLAAEPAELILSMATTEFYKADDTEYPITISEGGTVSGRGVRERSNGGYVFQPSRLQNDLNERVNVLIIGQLENQIKTVSVTVSERPSAEFRLGDLVSGTVPDNLNITLKRDRFPLTLTPKVPGGDFSVSDAEGNLQIDWLRGNPPRLLTLPENSELSQVTLTYRLPAEIDEQQSSSSLTIGIEPKATVPTEPTLTIDRNQFHKEDTGRYPIRFVASEGGITAGTVVGRGVISDGNGGFVFQPSQLQNDINEQINVLIIGWWKGGIKTITVTVYARPLAQFWLGEQASGPDLLGNEVTVQIAPSSPPILLTPKIQPGAFRAFQSSRLGEVDRTAELLQQNPPAFTPPQTAESDLIVVEYRLQEDSLWPDDAPTSSINIKIQSDLEPEPIPAPIPAPVPEPILQPAPQPAPEPNPFSAARSLNSNPFNILPNSSDAFQPFIQNPVETVPRDRPVTELDTLREIEAAIPKPSLLQRFFRGLTQPIG